MAVAILVPSVYLLTTGEIGNFDLIKASRELDATLEESERLGLPMTAADLEPNPPVPDADNAALIVVPAVASLKTWIGRLPFWGVDNKKQAEALRLLNENRETINKVKLGTKRKRWHIARDWDLGPMLTFSEYAQFKSVANLLSVDCVDSAMHNRPDDALAALIAGRRLAMLSSQNTDLLAIMIGVSIDTIMLRAAENLVEIWAKDDALLNRLVQAIDSTSFVLDPRGGFRTDFYVWLTIARNFDKYGGADGLMRGKYPDPSTLRREGFPTSTISRAMMNSYAKAWNQIFELMDDKYTPPAAWDPIAKKLTYHFAEPPKTSDRLAGIGFPVMDRFAAKLIKHELQPKLLIALIRAVQYRNRTGDFPKSLADINVDSADPLSGDKLRYVVDHEGVKLWSIGAEQKDTEDIFKGGLYSPVTGVVYPSSRRNKTKQ